MSAAAPAVRPARFAGSWYPGDAHALRRTLATALGPLDAAAPPAPALALMAPHAGYRYSLSIAAATYARVEVPPRVVVLCPNHTVPPPIVSLWPAGAWETPLGRVEVDEELATAIGAACPGIVREQQAHLREHAIELQLPLLQARQPALRIVPIVVAEPSPAALEALGRGIAGALARLGLAGGGALLVASSDMTHHEPAERAARRDRLALDRLEALDPAGLLETCRREKITMCGVRPTAVALWAALQLGATRAELIAYGHSGQVSGDDTSVVGYAGVVVR